MQTKTEQQTGKRNNKNKFVPIRQRARRKMKDNQAKATEFYQRKESKSGFGCRPGQIIQDFVYLRQQSYLFFIRVGV